MKSLWLLVLILLCTGCSSKPIWEYVEDEPIQAVMTWQNQAYTIQMAVPEHAVLAERREGITVYSLDNGAYRVSSCVFLASSMESAVRYLSGVQSEKLTIVQTSRFDLPEYQFAWCKQTEEGIRVYQADLVVDGITCYALITSVCESVGDRFDEVSREVYSSFGLYYNEEI